MPWTRNPRIKISLKKKITPHSTAVYNVVALALLQASSPNLLFVCACRCQRSKVHTKLLQEGAARLYSDRLLHGYGWIPATMTNHGKFNFEDTFVKDLCLWTKSMQSSSRYSTYYEIVQSFSIPEHCVQILSRSRCKH